MSSTVLLWEHPTTFRYWLMVLGSSLLFLVLILYHCIILSRRHVLERGVVERSADPHKAAREWQVTFDAVADAVWVLDTEQRIQRSNQASRALFCGSADSLIGRKCCQIVHGTSEPLPECPVRRMRDSRRRESMELTVGSRQYQVTVDPILGDAGEIKGIVHIVRDITEHRRVETALRDSQRQLRALASELVVAEEAQRRRIAEEIHDNIGQSLSISLLKLAALKPSAASAANIVNEVLNLIRKAAEDLRSMIFDLSSPVLYKLGLEEAIEEWLGEEMEGKNGITYSLTHAHSPPPLDNKLKVLLFRAVREVLVNVIKHAQASHVEVHLDWAPEQVQIVVHDNGVGFQPREPDAFPTREGGFGLLSIRERLTYLGGRFEIRSAPGQGTRAILTVPYSTKFFGGDRT